MWSKREKGHLVLPTAGTAHRAAAVMRQHLKTRARIARFRRCDIEHGRHHDDMRGRLGTLRNSPRGLTTPHRVHRFTPLVANVMPRAISGSGFPCAIITCGTSFLAVSNGIMAPGLIDTKSSCDSTAESPNPLGCGSCSSWPAEGNDHMRRVPHRVPLREMQDAWHLPRARRAADQRDAIAFDEPGVHVIPPGVAGPVLGKMRHGVQRHAEHRVARRPAYSMTSRLPW